MHIETSIKNKVDLFFREKGPNMGDALGIQFRSFKKDEVIGLMPVNKNTIQPFGILHGGASVALAETLASIGAWLNLDHDSKTAVGIEINANHIRSVKPGKNVVGTATPVQRGKTIHVWQIEIKTEDGKLVCTSRCTLAIVDKRDS